MSYAAPVQGPKTRVRPLSFGDHFSQARLFVNSLTAVERDHLAYALQFELGKVANMAIRERVVNMLTCVNEGLAEIVAAKIGVANIPTLPMPPSPSDPRNSPVPQNSSQTAGQAEDAILQIRIGEEHKRQTPETSPALSMAGTGDGSIKGRKFALLLADGVEDGDVEIVKARLHAEGAVVETVSPLQGFLKTTQGKAVEALRRFDTNPSLVYDGVVIAGGLASAKVLADRGDALHFVAEAFKHCKFIAAFGEGALVLERTPIPADCLPELTVGKGASGVVAMNGVIVGTDRTLVLDAFIESAGLHRLWTREGTERTPA